MADSNLGPKLVGLRTLQESLDRHRLGQPATIACAPQTKFSFDFSRLLRRMRALPVRSPWLRRAGMVGGLTVAVVVVGLALLWWRLSSGPIALDIATPWITAAIKENFGARHTVEVGGTILERDAAGRTAVRIVNIVVREPDGAVVVSAPRAEVGISGASLLSGRPRAASLKLVGTELSVRIGPDGQFTLLTASERPPAGSPAAASARPPLPHRQPPIRSPNRSWAMAPSRSPDCSPGSTACRRSDWMVTTLTRSGSSTVVWQSRTSATVSARCSRTSTSA
jgi:hypothetical protein